MENRMNGVGSENYHQGINFLLSYETDTVQIK
jgi:hypothetical protein